MDEAEWQSFQSGIQRLHIDANKTLAEVREYLKSKHGFPGTKTQYERQLKKWGLVKNQKISDLE
ncbi:Clr5 domain-containing protein [Aspergillus multicolor]|uniref:Clr5 domain-containing protein n=1 Tax=Aspergillus multicolor TaxID=41759 RepID=UPI003CCE0095